MRNQQPLINWKALSELGMPQRPPVKPVNGVNVWDQEAASYDKMSRLERELTLHQVNALPISPEDAVIDMGCGCGRLSIPIAKRVKSVTALDSSDRMMENCLSYADEEGITNLKSVKMDFFQAEAGVNVDIHDVALCSRSAAIWEPDKLSSFARKYACILIFANAPSIPELLGKLFAGTAENTVSRPMRPKDRRLDYNTLWNAIYDLGYEPNCRIVPDGFKAHYTSVEEACQDLRILGNVDADKESIFRANVEQFLTPADSGYDFLMKTRTAVIWWKTHPEQF